MVLAFENGSENAAAVGAQKQASKLADATEKPPVVFDDDDDGDNEDENHQNGGSLGEFIPSPLMPLKDQIEKDKV
ncbi:hypothetical protein U1Q18_020378 [Sarracenia purpurea var. burkii]